MFKNILAMAMCFNPALVRDKPPGAPASVKLEFALLQVHGDMISCLLQTPNDVSYQSI